MTQQLGLALRRLRATPGFTAVALASLALGTGPQHPDLQLHEPGVVQGHAVPRARPAPGREHGASRQAGIEGRGDAGAVPPAARQDQCGLRSCRRLRRGAIGQPRGRRRRPRRTTGRAPDFGDRPRGARRQSTTRPAPVAATDEAGRAPRPPMLLSYPVWQRRFGGRSEVVGQTVQVDGQPTQIIGVMPEGFGLLDNSSDALFPFGFEPPPGQEFQHNLRVVGRLKPGVSMADAQAAAKVALDEYAQKNPNRDKGWTVELTPWREARFGGMRQPFRMVQLAVGVMLLLRLRERGGADACAHGPGRASRGPRLETSSVLASCSPKACCSRSAAARSAPPSWRGDSRRSVTSPRPRSRVSVRSGSTPA